MQNDKITCMRCRADMKYYDTVLRSVRTKNRKIIYIKVKRYKCVICKEVHRQLPNYILPYKQYSAEIILGVVKKLITSELKDYEDYPCEMTMLRWRKEFDATESG